MRRSVGWICVMAVGIVAVAGGWAAWTTRTEGLSTARKAAAGSAAAATNDGSRARKGARQALFAELQPVKLQNCELARFGETNDGGYLLCRNLLQNVGSAYSYGISGYDGWGCEVSTVLRVPVHQYDCFNTKQPACPAGRPLFHAECISGSRSTDAEGRLFDSLESQVARNGDAGKQLVVKMDVEGAEWDSVLQMSGEMLDRIDQMIFEFHGVAGDTPRYLEVIRKLKNHFHVASLHFNNYSCRSAIEPFPAWAYEVTLVSKRLATVDESGGGAAVPHPLDTPNHPQAADCQSVPLFR